MRKELGWPAAATMIAALVGAVATAFAMTSNVEMEPPIPQHVSTARELGEVKARLVALENASHQLRIELREDIQELRQLIQTVSR